MSKYDHKKIEKKWQEKWEKEKLYKTPAKPKHKQYILDMFPYPSGAGLHVGHPEGYTATDIVTRHLRMKGFDVLHPMGWDAFGLPAENYAIAQGVAPASTTQKNIDRFRTQIKSIGLSYDWEREVNTSEPSYYKWTQWLFLKLYQNGKAYKKEAYVNWCPKDQTVLANEQVVDGCCERCGTKVVQKLLSQWFFKITDYVERLLSELQNLDWPEPIKLMQKNWIGRSEGAEIDFELALGDEVKNLDFVFLHAFKDTHKDAFWPWLKKQLEARGAKVYAPDLPNHDKPNIEQQVDYVLANHKFRKTTVIITHSLGGVVAMKLLPHLPGPINHLIMAAPPLRTEFLDGKQRPELADCCDWKFDFAAIKAKAEKITALLDKKDSIIPPSHPTEIAKNLSANLISVEASQSHFNGNEEPVVLAVAVPKIKVFTTRPDTLFGATYMVLAPEHPLVSAIATSEKKAEVAKYIEDTKGKTEMQRTALEKDKTGVFTGAFAVNPATKEKISVWIADYVLASYGTGAIMAVPAHDERDFEFAKKYSLPVKQVVAANSNVIILHGCPSSNENDPAKRTYDKHWIQWLKEELEKGGIKAEAPLMPNPWEPVYADWKKEFEKLSVNENTILIGHSCAAAFLTRWLGETKRSVKKLIFVGGARIAREGDHRKDDLYLTKISPDIKNKIKDVILFISNDDPRHIEASKIYARELNGRIVELKNRGHFTFKDMGTNKFPELLDEILNTDKASTDYGVSINSDKYSGLTSIEAKKKMAKDFGVPKIQYKLRDWLVSRQRYWGAPIPIIYCDDCGMQPVPEKDLPVKLPTDVDFKPTGESPLTRSKEFHKVSCPKCHKPARRDSDTMDTFVDSSWYFIRFTDPNNDKAFADKKEIKKWLPVDLYVGGAEHAVLHLLYARFITKALADFGLLGFEEPFLKLRNQGLILGPDGEKMSKSRGNVVNPEEVIEEFGADSLRLYEMFMGPLEDAKPWSTRGIIGVRRFLDRVYDYFQTYRVAYKAEPEATFGGDMHLPLLHKTIRKVTSDIEVFKFNTAISQLMVLINELRSVEETRPDLPVYAFYDIGDMEKILIILAPFAPHLMEELWQQLGHKDSIHSQKWPKFDEQLAQDETVTIVIQVLGRLRATLEVPRGTAREDIKQKAMADANVKKYLEGKEVVKEIFVKDKLINFVVK